MSAVSDHRLPDTAPEPAAPGAVFGGDLVLTSDHSDQSVRWTPGERLHHVFEATCDRLRAAGDADRLAVSRGDLQITYAELDARANRLARFLRSRGVLPGDRVGLVFDDPVWGYAGMLAVLKVHAAYVPLDAGFPPDRMAFIVEDAHVSTVLTLGHLVQKLTHAEAQVLALDEQQAAVDHLDGARLKSSATGRPADELSYVIYTSGTTGRPKGVPIEHAAIVNFVRVAAEVYGVRPDDRMYQGLTLAFDFSVEEIWVAWAVGATLVPKPGANLLGEELARFLRDERVTALCCVPTLLATMDDDLPDLRFLLVSGEACPQDLVARWHRPGRRFLNTYGPTEATVTATWTTVEPDQRVTIGVPLPTYSVVILAEDSDTVLPRGEQGEIAIGGVCLSPGYLNRAEATAKAFVPDPVGVPNNPSGQVYRTGDLGRITDGERIEYLGRIDTQVKIRGYRIELTEIESLLLRLPGVAQAVVDTHRPGPGAVELVAYYTQRPSGPPVDTDAVFGALRERLPSYMVPAYLERLDTMPMLPSDKVDRKNLPAPRGPRRVERRGAHVPAEGAAEEALAGAIGDLLGIDDVSVEGHFFEELGLNSLMLAQLRNRLRNHAAVAAPTTQDMYRHPTVRSLVAVLGTPAPRAADRGPRAVYSAPRAAYLLTGAAQAGLYVGFAYLLAFVGVTGYEWLAAGTGLLDVYLRSVTVAGATLALLTFLPVAVKWLLVGRFAPGVFRVWGLRYLRFWLVRQLLRTSPAMLFVGSPVYAVYLRLLGAKVGRGAVVQSTSLPVCADLITIGAGAVVRKDSHFSGYRAESGRIRTGPVTIGADALVGEATVLDIDTEIGAGAQLGHTSSLQVGQRVPAGARWHGSPARETSTDYRTVATGELTRRRRLGYSVLQILGVLLGWGPIATGIAYSLLPAAFPGVASALGLTGAAGGSGGDQHEFADPAFYLQHFLIAGALLFGAGLAGILVVTTVARLLGRAVAAGVTYPLYGWRYSAHRAARRLGNIPFFHNMLGDSSYIVGYLRAIGYDLSGLEQTGSNFGLALKHDSAVRTHVGTGTLVSDGLSIVNADYSSTSFTVSDVSVGSRSFFGNAITYPAQGRTGDDCLLGTKVMVPVDGPVRSGIGLLGSPSFEIPRSVQRDVSLDHYRAGPEFRTRLAAKNRHNATTIGAFLLLRWLQVFGITLIGLAATDFYDEIGISAYAAAVVAVLLFTTLSSILAERLAMGFRRLAPRFCSIYDPYFWTHERLWKLSGTGYLQVFNGTPFKSLIWRMLGVRVGRQLFDDGVAMPEKTMVTIGDHCTLGADSTIQCHSLEDGSFKSDRTVLGDGVTVGAHTYVHYGVRMGDRTVLDPDAFLMKGEEPAADTRWRGNPAVETAGESVVEIPAPRSGAVTAGEPVSRTTGRVPAALAVAALSVLAVGQVLLAALRLPAGSAEATLVDGAFALVRGLPWPVTGDLVARVQVAGYAAVTGAFDRHADVLTGAREIAVLTAAVTVAALVVAAWRLRVRPAAVVVVLALLAVCRPAVEAFVTVGPGPLGVMWLTLGAALLTGGHRVPRVLGVVAVVLAVATAPVLAVAPATVIGVAAARRRPGIAVAAGLVGITALAAAWLQAGPVGGGTAPVLLVAAALTAAGGFALPGLRAAALGVAAAGLLAALPWPGAATAQAGLVVAVAALGAVLVAEVLVLAAGYRPALRRSVAGVAAAAWVALLVVLGAGPAPATTAHGALAAWLGTASDPTVQVSAQPGLWADLVRDGVPVPRLAADGRLVVGTAAPTAADLARFGALTVTDRGTGTAGASGSELADNPRLLATPAVRETLRSDSVDIRTLAVLAGLTGLGPVAVSDLPALPGETAALPRHVVVLGPVDAATLAWLRAQQAPFAPTITGPASGTTLSWPVPAPTALGG